MESASHPSLLCRDAIGVEMSQAELKLLYESPGGNLVDGLPPAAHNALVGAAAALGTKTMYGNGGLQT